MRIPGAGGDFLRVQGTSYKSNYTANRSCITVLQMPLCNALPFIYLFIPGPCIWDTWFDPPPPLPPLSSMDGENMIAGRQEVRNATIHSASTYYGQNNGMLTEELALFRNHIHPLQLFIELIAPKPRSF